jgi:pyrroline-5-carboxylate reductase
LSLSLAHAGTVDGMADLLIVGGGKMGEALLGGLLNAGHERNKIVVVEPLEERRIEISKRYGIVCSSEVEPCHGAILATKPNIVPEVASLLTETGVKRVLSIAAGVTTSTIDDSTGGKVPVIRAMPNTPALVGEGASAICGNSAATEDDFVWAESILGSVGLVVRTSETLLNSVTGLSGSGPAYIFLVAEALIDAGVLVGLPRKISTDLTIQTLLGAAKLLAEGKPAAELRADVTSPGGTTAAGLHELEKNGMRVALASAVKAATQRSEELGRS